MIVVHANLFIKEGMQNEFLNVANKCIVETRKEITCTSYRLLCDSEDNKVFTFVEEWETKEGLDEHMKTPHFIEFGKNIKELISKPLEIFCYKGEKL